jgi:hypothetical protein
LRPANTIAAGVVSEHGRRGLRAEFALPGGCVRRSALGSAAAVFSIRIVSELDRKEHSPDLRGMAGRPEE